MNFTKMHGLGNDYVCINREDIHNFIEDDKIEQTVKFLCNRNFGVGADGVIFIDKSDIADFKMSIFNKDGTQAEMCGNGIRCFGKYLYDNEMIKNEEITVETLGNKIKKLYLKMDNIKNELQEIQVNMGKPDFRIENGKFVPKNLKILDKNFDIFEISMGNPHAIIFVDDVEKIDICKYGKEIENHPYFPNKTNVEFAQVIDRGNIKMHVWERGVGETMACGTGACATAVASNLNGYTRKMAKVFLKGGELKINIDENTNEVFMTGIATSVFEGRLII